jgi:two-component system cell cycle response regulator
MLRALIIDDSRATRQYLSQLLEQNGWEVVTETDAERGAAAALASPPDVVISDLWMPGLSGLQLCRLLHADPLTANVPIVLLSASLDRRSRFWASQSGATLTIDKKQVSDLPGLLPTLLAHPQVSAVPRSAKREVSVASIPTRLSHLLDEALFESVVAKELRSLAFASNIDVFFGGLTDLLVQIVGYRWLAVSTLGVPRITRIHVHQASREAWTLEALRAINATESGDMRIVADERAAVETGVDRAPPPGREPEILVMPIEMAGVGVARMAVGSHEAPMPAADRLVFDLVRTELAPALRSVLLAEDLRRLAATDALTGLLNRRQGGEALDQALAVSKRYGHPFSVVMLDIDHFKQINDTWGHHAGDLALQHVANILRRTSRKADAIVRWNADAVVRWGGEEFLVLLPSTPAGGARIAAERLRLAVSLNAVSLAEGNAIPITVSIGLASYEDGSAEALIQRADKALYQAKARGRNRVEVG